MQIIGLTGPIGSGKTAAALALHTIGYTRIRFAEPLKAMLKALGLDDAELEGSLKEVPCSKLDERTPRYAMQTLGTEWGRERISGNLWVNAWKRRVLALDSSIQNLKVSRAIYPASVVADDVRFENEVDMIRRMGGKVIRVQRPTSYYDPITNHHSSERFAYTPDAIWQNDGDLGQWHERVKALAKKLFP